MHTKKKSMKVQSLPWQNNPNMARVNNVTQSLSADARLSWKHEIDP